MASLLLTTALEEEDFAAAAPPVAGDVLQLPLLQPQLRPRALDPFRTRFVRVVLRRERRIPEKR